MNRWLILIFCFFSWSAQAKLLVITDIDDTLRLTNRQASWFEQLANVSDSSLAFKGLPEIFHRLQDNGVVVAYVTAAISPIDELSQEFLEDNNFPQQHNFFNKGWFDDTRDYKIETMKALIQKHQPDRVVLIGDNGEYDVAAQDAVMVDDTRVVSIVHKLYEDGATIPVNHTLFLTGADLAAQLAVLEFISQDQALEVISHVQAALDSGDTQKRNLVLPDWAEVTAADISKAFSIGSLPAFSKALAPIEQALSAQVLPPLQLAAEF